MPALNQMRGTSGPISWGGDVIGARPFRFPADVSTGMTLAVLVAGRAVEPTGGEIGSSLKADRGIAL